MFSAGFNDYKIIKVCKNGLPHHFVVVADLPNCQYEVCDICGYKIRSNKDNKGRVDNVRYLAIHARDYAQPNGRTHQLFMRCYHPQYTVASICTNTKCIKNGVCTHKIAVRTGVRFDSRLKGTNNPLAVKLAQTHPDTQWYE